MTVVFLTLTVLGQGGEGYVLHHPVCAPDFGDVPENFHMTDLCMDIASEQLNTAKASQTKCTLTGYQVFCILCMSAAFNMSLGG